MTFTYGIRGRLLKKFPKVFDVAMTLFGSILCLSKVAQ